MRSNRAQVWRIDWRTAAVALWAAGALVFAVHMAWLMIRLRRRLIKNSLPVPGRVAEIIERCKSQMGIKARLPVTVQSGMASPALSSSIRPRLLIPESMALHGRAEQIEFGIRHELTHYRRKDHLLNLLLMLLRCVYWFNPVVHLAYRQIQLDIETACDVRATADMQTNQRISYVQTMIDLCGGAGSQTVMGMGMCKGRKAMERRVKGVFMKRKAGFGIKTAAAVMAGLLVVCCFTTACQPTPDEAVVVNKNKNLVEEVQKAETESAAADSPCYLKALDLPECYTFSSQNETASLKINVDADVTKPQADKMPFARVKAMSLTQEMVTGMFNYLFPDEKPFMPREQKTRSEIQDEIIGFKRILERGTLDGDPIRDDTIEEFNQMIKELEKEYETAPEQEPEPVVCDGTLQKSDFRGHICYEVNAHMPDPENDAGTTLFIRTGGYGDHMSVWYINVDSTFSTDGMVRVTQDGELPEAARGKLNLPLSKAIAKADGFFAAAGLDHIKLFAAYVVDNHGTGHVDENYDPASEYAFKLFYTQTVNGVPVSCHESNTASGGDEYSKPWFYESIEFLISDNGILEIKWSEPSAVTEIIEEDTQLIDFDTAVKKFENAVTYTYGQYMHEEEDIDTTVDIEIDNIQLNLIRMREKDKTGEKAGIYVPAYVFYGAVKETCHDKKEEYTYEGYKTSAGGGNDFYPGPLMVMAINAVDGSVIDTMKDVT